MHIAGHLLQAFSKHQIQYDSKIDTNQDNKNDSSYEGPNVNPALRDTTTQCVYLILDSFVVYRKEVNLVIVIVVGSLNFPTVPTALYCFSFIRQMSCTNVL